MILTFFAPLLAVHFVAYFAIFRHMRAFGNEKVILLYHCACFALATTVFGGRLLMWPSYDNLVELVFVAAAHGIYSLSLLELWTLAEGGYSLSILIEYERARKAGTKPDFDNFTTIGDSKKLDRLSGLEKMGLLRNSGSSVSLTNLGTVAAAFLGVIVWLANVQEGG